MANVARLNLQFKGQDVLSEALGREPWSHRPWLLRFYGASPDRPYFERLARYYGVGEKV
jgi:hypothetical protein